LQGDFQRNNGEILKRTRGKLKRIIGSGLVGAVEIITLLQYMLTAGVGLG